MTLKDQIDEAIEDAPGLERIYRRAVAAGEEAAFKDAIARCALEHGDALLPSAWVYRLDIQPVAEPPDRAAIAQRETRSWKIAVAGSVVLGLVYALLAGDKPPVPVPGQALPAFWLGWGPVTALGILGYLAAVDRDNRLRWYAGAALIAALIGGGAAWMMWGRTDNAAVLTAIHLPFAVWAAVGGSVALGRENPALQFHAFMVKSVETLLTVGIYLGAGGLLVGLSVGIFAALGIRFSDVTMHHIAASGMGAVPLLALASVCDLSVAPTNQNWRTGLARLLHILTRLMLPLSLGVLAVYVGWFIPVYFGRPFQEREVLIVYNATLVAIVVLLASVVPGRAERGRGEHDRIVFYALVVLGILSLLLNAYALAAIVSRTLAFGLSVNRHAVLGWNAVTLLMLAAVTFRLWRTGPAGWREPFRATLARVMGLAVGWTAWVLFVVPNF